MSCYLFALSSSFGQEYAVFTMNSAIPSLNTIQVKLLYRGKLNHIAGQPILLLDLPDNTEQRDRFYQALLGKNRAQMRTVWAKQTFSGRAKKPFELQSAELTEVLLWLKSNPNGVAYFHADQVPNSVKVLYHMSKETP